MHRIAVSQCNPNQKSLRQNKSYWIQSRLPTPISGSLQSGKITVAPTILLLMAAMVNEGGQDDQPQIKPMPSYESLFEDFSLMGELEDLLLAYMFRLSPDLAAMSSINS